MKSKNKFCYSCVFQNGPAERQSNDSIVFRAGHKVSEAANLVGLAKPSAPSKSAWTVAKVSTDVQAVVKKLLWIVTACGVSFEAVPRIVYCTTLSILLYPH